MFRYMFLFLSLPIAAQSVKVYKKNKIDSGVVTSEGWLFDGVKSDYWYTYNTDQNIYSEGHFKVGLKEKYWYFYQPNKKILKEGHYRNGLMCGWWVFYDNTGSIACKKQYDKDKKQGFCVLYAHGEVFKIEKYRNDIKVGEWTDLKSFELENELNELLK